MTVATLDQVLKLSIDGGFCVAGLVVQGWEDARAFVEAAEETGLPIVLQAGPGSRRYTPLAVLGKMFRALAEPARVPVALHVDHAYSLEECRAGVGEGFTSVMIDGSRLPLEENIALTRSVVDMAHAGGVSVEGEIGVVGYVEGAASQSTAPQDARAFERGSGVDAVAVSIGNVHLSRTATSDIDFAALASLEAATTKPLVLHGGSGVPPAARRRLARESRVRKLNIGTELRMAFGRALRLSLAERPEAFDRLELLGATIPALRAETRRVLLSLRGDPAGDGIRILPQPP